MRNISSQAGRRFRVNRSIRVPIGRQTGTRCREQGRKRFRVGFGHIVRQVFEGLIFEQQGFGNRAEGLLHPVVEPVDQKRIDAVFFKVDMNIDFPGRKFENIGNDVFEITLGFFQQGR